MITLMLGGWADLVWAQEAVTEHHYLRAPVDPRSSPETLIVFHQNVIRPIGCLIFGRPEATRCYPWYGGVADVAEGRAEVTRWQVLNLARVWLHPSVQRGGRFHRPGFLPGYTDRRGVWRSTLASHVLYMAAQRIGYDYLLQRPPAFPEEPYQLRYLLSYCDPRHHRGTIYRAAGWERYRVNARGLETWRIALPPLTPEQDAVIQKRAEHSARSRRHRSQRHAHALAAQTSMELP